MNTIGITGTNGKTTSKELINSVLNSQLNCYATKGNLNNHIGVPLSLLEINAKHEIAIIEMGANHQKEIEFLCNIVKPTYGAITNIGTAHLEGFKDLATHLHKLHQDEYLKMPVKSEGNKIALPDEVSGILYFITIGITVSSVLNYYKKRESV